MIIGGGFTYSTLYACNQTQVQRMLTVKNLKAAQKAMFLNWPILSLLSISTCFSGLALYAYYAKCDPVLNGRISSRDQVSDFVPSLLQIQSKITDFNEKCKNFS